MHREISCDRDRLAPGAARGAARGNIRVSRVRWKGLSLFLPLLLALFSAAAARAQSGAGDSASSPVGSWKTVDDVTGKSKSIVSIWEQDGKLYGKIQKLLDPDAPADPRCQQCTGDLKGQPFLGLRILWDLQRDGDGWSGGTILDPENGKTYKCLLSLEDGGTKLKVRGFLGLSLLGRTQYWLRDSD